VQVDLAMTVFFSREITSLARFQGVSPSVPIRKITVT